MKEIVVMRLGHRPERDKRITTHVGLVARAFGSKGMLLASKDTGIKESLDDVTARWGGTFFLKNDINWKREIKDWKNSGGKVCHLSMYGLNLSDISHEIKTANKLMIVVGAEKVPPEIYELADWNVAVGNQPHSEVAALAVTLDRILDTDPLKHDFSNPKLEIKPMPIGKKVTEK